MAIPQRGIRWQISFRSLKGYDCRVNIYLEGYNGTISQLKGGDVPVYFDEDDDSNLLRVIRTKTGYISFIEESYGYWNAVYPSSNIDRYVEIVYNNIVMFRGFLQAQTFDNKWQPGPREIQIPIISVLGVTHSLFFNPNNLGDGALTTGAIIKKALDEVGVSFNSVVFPETSGTDSRGKTIPQVSLNEAIRTLAICPYNDQYDRQEHSTAATDLYNPCSVYQFLEGVCNAYGWILHEWEDKLIFTKHDHTGSYLMRTVSSLDNINGNITVFINSQTTLDEYITISSDQNIISSVMPVRRLELNYETNIIDSGYLDFGRCATYIRYWNTNGRLYYFLTPMSNEFGGSLLRTMSQIAWGDRRLESDGCYITFAAQQSGAIGEPWEEVGKGIMIQWSTSWASKTKLFWVRLPYPAVNQKVTSLGPSGAITVSITYVIDLELAWATSLYSDYVDEYFKSKDHGDFTIDVGIGNQDGKWLSNGQWVDTETFRTITIDGSTGKIKKDRNTRSIDEFNIRGPVQSDSLFIIFRTDNNNNISDHEPIFFKKIGWKTATLNMFGELFERPVDRHFDSNNGSNKTVNVDQFLTPYRYSENLIGDDRVDAAFTEYDYMFSEQKELKIDSRHSLPSEPYLHPFTFNGRDDWKILAIGFEPRNDEYKILLHTF